MCTFLSTRTSTDVATREPGTYKGRQGSKGKAANIYREIVWGCSHRTHVGIAVKRVKTVKGRATEEGKCMHMPSVSCEHYDSDLSSYIVLKENNDPRALF